MKDNRDFEYKFARNVHGKVVPEDGSHLNRNPTRTIPKYEMESHFLLGVAAVPLEDGRMVGRWLKLFVDTNKKVVSHKDWKEELHMEVLGVRRGGSKNKWVKKGEQESRKIWEEDDVSKMNGVSKKTKQKLVRAGIKTVIDLKYLDNHEETMHA
eukprot:6758573-Ditylum_brightwellii.AAC.1